MNEATKDPDLLTVDEVARATGRAPKTIRNDVYRRRGVGKYVLRPGGGARLLWRRDDVMRWLSGDMADTDERAAG